MATGLTHASTTKRKAPITSPANSAGVRQSSGERPLFQIRRRSRDSVKALSLHTTPRKVAKGMKGGKRSERRKPASRTILHITCSGLPLNKGTCGHRSIVKAMVISAAVTIMVWRR
jgi:hypothetical protein